MSYGKLWTEFLVCRGGDEMVRKIIRVDNDQCTGCGECVRLCRQGALEVVGGKAKLVADRLCDGLGVCAKQCAQKALLLERREAAPFLGRFISDAEAARLAGGITAVADRSCAPIAQPAGLAAEPTKSSPEPTAQAGKQPDADDIVDYRLGLCCRATQCGRLCKRLVKQPGKAGVWCVDVKTNTRTNLYQALAQPSFTCPDGAF